MTLTQPRCDTSSGSSYRGLRRARFALGLCSLAVTVCVATLFAMAVVPMVVPGWTSTAVSSGSMRPSIWVGDAVVVQEIEDYHNLDYPTVALVEREGEQPLLHRIRSQRADGSYVTRGDANENEDSTPVRPNQLLGVGRLAVPFVGFVALWVQTGNLVALVLLASSVTVLALISRWATPREDDDEHVDPSGEEQPEDGGPTASSPPTHGPCPAPVIKIAVALVTVLLAGSLVHRLTPVAAALAGRDAAKPNTTTVATITPPTGLKAAQRCVAATPTYVSKAYKPPGATALSMPAGIQPGDVLVALVHNRSGSTYPPTPSGWTRLGRTEVNTRRAVLWAKVAQASDVGSSLSDLPSTSGAIVSGFRGAAVPATQETGGMTLTESYSTLGGSWNAQDLYVGMYSMEAPNGRIGDSFNDGLNTDTGALTGGSHTMNVRHVTKTRSGSQGTTTVSISPNAMTTGFTFTLKPRPTKYVDLSWSASGNAAGYRLERPTGTAIADISGRTAVTYSDVQPPTGTQTYAVRSTLNSWTSAPATLTTNVTAC